MASLTDKLLEWINTVNDLFDRPGFPHGQKGFPVGGGVRTVDLEDPDVGPIFQWLAAEGYITIPTEDTPNEQATRQLREQIQNTPESVLERAERATRDKRGIKMNYNDFMSIGLDQLGSDKQTFRDLAKLWSNKKAEIRQMNETELRESLIQR